MPLKGTTLTVSDVDNNSALVQFSLIEFDSHSVPHPSKNAQRTRIRDRRARAAVYLACLRRACRSCSHIRYPRPPPMPLTRGLISHAAHSQQSNMDMFYGTVGTWICFIKQEIAQVGCVACAPRLPFIDLRARIFTVVHLRSRFRFCHGPRWQSVKRNC